MVRQRQIQLVYNWWTTSHQTNLHIRYLWRRLFDIRTGCDPTKWMHASRLVWLWPTGNTRKPHQPYQKCTCWYLGHISLQIWNSWDPRKNACWYILLKHMKTDLYYFLTQVIGFGLLCGWCQDSVFMEDGRRLVKSIWWKCAETDNFTAATQTLELNKLEAQCILDQHHR